MQNDEQLIADLTASLRQAVAYIKAEAGFDERDLAFASPIRASFAGKDFDFDAIWACQNLERAAARLATIQPRQPALALRFTPDRAAVLSEGMSDLLCWCAGFSAALGPELDRHPYGVEATRIVREELRAASLTARGQQDEEMPF